MNLTATCSVVIQKSLLVKMQDPGSFTIPCTIGSFEFKKALCDSGHGINLMPLLVVKKLSLGEFTPTAVTVQITGQWNNQKESLKMFSSRWENSFSLWTL